MLCEVETDKATTNKPLCTVHSLYITELLHLQVGDSIAPSDMLYEMETDKANKPSHCKMFNCLD